MKTKKLGLKDMILMGIGYTIGSGVFIFLGIGVGMTGRSVYLAVIAAALVSLMSCWYSVVVSSMVVVEGGDYGVMSTLLPPFLSGVLGVMVIFVGTSISSYGMGLVSYLSMLVPGIADYAMPITVIIITMFIALAFTGNVVNKIAGVATAALIAALAVFIVIGLPNVKYVAGEGEPFLLGGGVGFMMAMTIMMRACQGATTMPAVLMPQTKNARKNAPLAMLLITLIVAAVYALMAFVASTVLPISQVAGQNLAVVAQAIFPDWFYLIFLVFGPIFAIATSVMTLIISISNSCTRLGTDGWLPKVFSSRTKNGSPWAVLLLFYLISVLPVAFNFSIEAVTSYSMIPLALLNIYLNISLIPFRRKYEKQWKNSFLGKVPVPLFNVLCVIGALSAVFISYNLFTLLTLEQIIGMIVLIAVMLVWVAFRIKSGAADYEALKNRRNELVTKSLEITSGAEQ